MTLKEAPYAASNLRGRGQYHDRLLHKNDLPYRQHWRSHPVHLNEHKEIEATVNGTTGLIRQFKLRKLRTRRDRGNFH